MHMEQDLSRSRVRDLLSVIGTDMFFWQLPLPCQACQEMLAECCSATCDTSAVIAVTSLSPGQEVTQVKFMQLPAALDTYFWCTTVTQEVAELLTQLKFFFKKFSHSWQLRATRKRRMLWESQSNLNFEFCGCIRGIVDCQFTMMPAAVSNKSQWFDDFKKM